MAMFWFPEFRSEVDDVEDEAQAIVEAEATISAPSPRVQYLGLYLLAGDFRGRYGYGRPAHMSDPGGTYVFQPRRRTLPPRI
jgi:hypothetical protein